MRTLLVRQDWIRMGCLSIIPDASDNEAKAARLWIVDSDEWGDNFKRGMVTNYDFLTGLHTIQIESIEELDCYGREIRKALRS